jgi:hypothetical protein
MPLVHTLNPDFLGQQLWLCFSAGSWMSSRVTPELGPQQIPESALLLRRFAHVLARDSRTEPSTDSRIGHPPKFAPSPARGSGLPHVRDPIPSRTKIPELHTFANSRLHRFQTSENREFPAPEKHVSRTLLNLTFRGWRVFLNSPTVWQSGIIAVLIVGRKPSYQWSFPKVSFDQKFVTTLDLSSMMNILTTWPFSFPKPPWELTFVTYSFSFALHCFANVKLSNLVYFSSPPWSLDIAFIFFLQWSYLFHAIHYSLIPSFPYLIFLLLPVYSFTLSSVSILFIVYLLAFQTMLYFGFFSLAFDSKVSHLIQHP